jgi:two-component system chemotaxis sensor kinase CheA
MKASDKEFIAETEELLNESTSLLLSIQDNPDTDEPDPDTINALFRCMHTLKGMSGLFGFQAMADVSHALENILDLIRLGKAVLDEPATSFLFNYIDVLRGFTEEMKKGIPPSEDVLKDYIEEIETFTKSMGRKRRQDDLLTILGEDFMSVLSEYEESRLKNNIGKKKGIYKVSMAFSLDDFDTRLKDITEKIKPSGELISTMPMSEGIPVGSIGFNLIVGSTESNEFFVKLTEQEVSTLIEPKSEDEPKKATPATLAQQDAVLHTSTDMIRVDIGKLDEILHSVGELMLVKNSIRNLWSIMADKNGKTPEIISLYKLTQGMNRHVYLLQDQILQLRMVPVGQIFNRLGQVIRRYSRSTEKQIRLSLFGEETEIDKFLAEEVIDPLMHIVRNAIDHGIESEEIRKQKGKNPVGSVILKAFQKGNSVVIEVNDDGGGIDTQVVLDKGIQKGLVLEGELREDRDIFELMFLPGFSTKDTVSETSGRGVGLDVVKQKLSDLGGYVDVLSNLGEGTTFTLTLPITLAIVRALLVRISEETFVIPLSSISETIVIEHKDIQQIESGEAINFRGEILPVVDLRKFLELPHEKPQRSFAVIAGHGDRRMGLLTDEIISQQEVVIKPISEYLDNIIIFAGAAEIANNEVVLVLDTDNIINEVTETQKVLKK